MGEHKIRMMKGTIVAAALALVGCQGAVVAPETVSSTEMLGAKQEIGSRALPSSRTTEDEDEARWRVRRLFHELKPHAVAVCEEMGLTECRAQVEAMEIDVVDEDSVNAYADASNSSIGMHLGLMRAAGSDGEVAGVIGHEMAHLLLGHAQKKQTNAMGGMLIGALITGAIAYGTCSPYCNPQATEDFMRSGMETGAAIGATAYSPEMELEADKMGAYIPARTGYVPVTAPLATTSSGSPRFSLLPRPD